MKERLSLDLEDYSLAAQKALVTKLFLCLFFAPKKFFMSPFSSIFFHCLHKYAW